jgi:hypothetical protein
LKPELIPCSIANPDLSQHPTCGLCLLSLDQSLPTTDLAARLAEINAALGEKTRRLSHRVVVRIIRQEEMDETTRKFLAVVQASDLSALSNTITPELVAFIQGLLGRDA